MKKDSTYFNCIIFGTLMGMLILLGGKDIFKFVKRYQKNEDRIEEIWNKGINPVNWIIEPIKEEYPIITWSNNLGYAKIQTNYKVYDFCFECLRSATLVSVEDEILTVKGKLYYCEGKSEHNSLIHIKDNNE